MTRTSSVSPVSSGRTAGDGDRTIGAMSDETNDEQDRTARRAWFEQSDR